MEDEPLLAISVFIADWHHINHSLDAEGPLIIIIIIIIIY